jgi:EmrB/QacA subfamily drug resistance transporter
MTAAAIQPACDRAIAASLQPREAVAATHPRLVLATTIIASSLSFIDGSVVNVGLPAIGSSIGADGGALSWVINGYLLPLGALLLIGGAAGDLYGRRRLLILGTAVFALASAVCAAAPNLTWLLFGRIVQGIGAALLLPNSLAILGATFSGEERGRAIGIWAAVGAGAGAVGPLIGGWLIDIVGWRAIFFLNLPIALAALILAARYVPDDRVQERPALDLAGATLVAAGLAAMTWGLTVASAAKAMSSAAAIALAGGAAMFGLFLLVEARRGNAAMMPLALFQSRSFVGLTLLTFLLYGALGGVLVLVPYVLIEASKYSATMAGAALLPFPLMIAATSSWMGRVAARIGPRLQLSLGPVIVAAGFLLSMSIGGDGSYLTTTFPAILVMSLGMACAAAPLTTAVLSSVDREHTGVASGLNSAVARIGGLIATALASAVLTARGAELVDWYQTAALIGAGVAAAAGASAWLLLQTSGHEQG